MSELRDRRDYTGAKIVELRRRLADSEKLASKKACVYATGSFGRAEANNKSDLDVFIVSMNEADSNKRLLKRLDEICIKADLIQATRDLGIPEFDGDGRFLLKDYAAHEFLNKLGTSDDDVTNTFTARLLLLLESRPLLESDVYDQVTKDVIAAYWRDYEDHKSNFVPAFVANDILRMWRTFCVNYEAGTQREPESKKVKGKIKNYNLKHSRLLTCYSALLYLLLIFKRSGTVGPADAVNMIKLTPTERLEWMIEQPESAPADSALRNLLDRYEKFLATKSMDESELARIFGDKKTASKFMGEAAEFGDQMFDALRLVGEGNKFHRLLVV